MGRTIEKAFNFSNCSLIMEKHRNLYISGRNYRAMTMLSTRFWGDEVSKSQCHESITETIKQMVEINILATGGKRKLSFEFLFQPRIP